MITIDDLKCEYAANPLGVDAPRPRLSWTLHHPERGQRQSAYQVLVASSPADLEAERGDCWDSGKVPVDLTLPVEYGGRPLESGERCYWKARAWDNHDLPGPYGPPAWFEMGLLHPQDWRAEWIGFPGGWNGKAIYFRNEFFLDRQVRRARVYLAGLGYSELHLNGRKVDDHVLDPGFTDYSRRVLYITYDVGQELVPGKNVIGVVLGNGWHGSPKLLLQMQVDYAGGTTAWILTGRQGQGGTWWRASTGPIQENSIYGGEVYDARLEKPGWDSPDGEAPDPRSMRVWSGGMAVDPPAGRLVSQMVEPIRVVDTLPAINLTQPMPGVYVFDLGQNFAGWARLQAQGPRGSCIKLIYAESLHPDGRVNQENLRSADATDIYIMKGEGLEAWEPRFTYHGFRYVQVEGYPGEPGLEAIQGRVVRSSVEPAGEFACSHPLLNRIHQMVRWTENSNLHSLPTDCPQRDERMGWLNDMGARTEEALCNFNLSRLLPKWVNDIADAQDPVTGAISDTAPYRWGSRPADPVSVCYLMIPWQLYLHYGDRGVVKDHYQGMKHWVDYLNSRAEGGILSYSYYGDWAPPVEQCVSPDSAVSKNTPGALISTGFLFYSARLLAQMARLLGKIEDEAAYAGLAGQVCTAYQERFWDEAQGGYGTNNQACNSFSLYMGLVPPDRRERVLANLVRDVRELHEGHLTTGNLCTKYLLEALTAAGRGDVALRLAAQTTYPSWGYMAAHGATTVWERWELRTGGGMNSHNHPMLGSVGSWLYQGLVGIRVDPEGPGFSRFRVRPLVTEEVEWARASLSTIRGKVVAGWERHPDAFHLEVTVPVGSEAQVSVPALKWEGHSPASRVEISESGQVVWKDGAWIDKGNGIQKAWEDGPYITFRVGSGNYNFISRARTPTRG